MESLKHIIPHNSLKDTLAVLVVLLSLPTPLTFCVLILFILTSSSKKFASRLFTKLFGSSSNYQPISLPSSLNLSSSSNQTKDQPENNYFTPLILIGSIDAFLSLIVRFALPRFSRYVFVLADAIIAATLCGNNIWNSCISTIFIALLENSVRLLLSYLKVTFDFNIENPELFPYLPKPTMPFSYIVSSCISFFKFQNSSSQKIQINSYYSHLTLDQSRLLSSGGLLINYLNLGLSIHIVLMLFASISRKNFISRNINQLTNLDQDIHYSPFSTFLLNKEKEDRNIKLIEIEVPESTSNSVLKLDDIHETESQAPASYPSNSKSSDELVSTSSIVQENFEVFCRSSFTKPKNSTKTTQPLWSLIATMKAMTFRKDVYSGRVHVNEGDNNSLVLSDSVSKYDENELQNYQDGYRREKILIFIDYIGETLISFQLKNFDHYKDVIVIRVNGLIWYQVSSGIYDDEQYFIVGGLTPLSQYDIQFLIEEKNEHGQKKIVLIDDLIVSTVDSNGDDISTTNTNSTNGGKPLSPLTTLRGSIVTTNANLNKERTKLKKTRKEISKKISSYKQDIGLLKTRISSSDNNDEKNWKKVLSLRSSVKQVEEEVSKTEVEMNRVESKENEISEIYAIEKRKFDLVQRNHQNFKNSYNSKLTVKRDLLKELSNDIETVSSKNEKLTNKYDRLNYEVDKLGAEIAELYSNEVLLRSHQRKKRADKRSALLNEFKIEIEKQEGDVLRLQTENEQLKNSLQNS